MKIYALRHGKTEYIEKGILMGSGKDISLSERGVKRNSQNEN